MKSGKAILFFAIITLSLISFLIEGLKREGPDASSIIPTLEVCEDGFTVTNTAGDRYHERSWETANRTFCAYYDSKEALSLNLGQQRNLMTFKAMEYKDLWGTVYKNLVKDSKRSIVFLVDSLSNLASERKLGRADLAEMIVTFVQDIPYSYILNVPCESYETKGKPCIGNIALGILTPYEFLHSLYGDCDTRAVLIYALLEEMGFDPMIVVSNEYAHAMLALNIAATGDHLKHNGKHYYFWETTARGWPIGMLPPSTGNVNYWKVALVDS